MNRPTETRFPNGEDFQEMRQRVLAGLDEVLTRQSKKTIAIVAHGGVNRVILARVLSIPDSQIFRLAQRYAAVNRIDYFENGATVELINGLFPAASEVHV
jgi:alpha-ribazole phosphatase/probable phosphoglycerate mutase